MNILPIPNFAKALVGRRWLLAATLGLFGTTAAQAQLNFTAASGANVAGTFTDLGTTGTVITTTSTDDANSAAVPLGFTFSFNGATFTDFVFNTNGLIRLGTAAPSAANLFPSQDGTPTNTAVDPITSTNAANVNVIMPFNIDLVSGTGGAEYRYITTGAAGARVTTIQWKNVSDKAGSGTDMSATQFASFTFQAKLYEGSNNVEFVYGPKTRGTGTDTFRFPNVGLKGSTSMQSVLANKTTSSAPWSATVFILGPYGTTTHNFRGSVPPDLGRTYRFRAISATTVDAAVTTVYTLGQLAQTVASPHVVRAVVKNSGGAALTNLPVTLTVTGANPFTNTQTVPSLAAGATATVTFAGYALANTGTNTVTVATNAPGDAVSTNDAQSEPQVVSANQLNYVAPSVTTFDGGLGSNTAANVFLLSKYTINGTANVTAITPAFDGMGPGTYEVQVYRATAAGTPGTMIYSSPTQTRPAMGGAATITFPAVAVTGSFFVAVKQLTTTNVGVAYVDEVPGRLGAFYFSSNGTTFIDLNAMPNFLDIRFAIGATLTPVVTTCAPVTSLSARAVNSTAVSVFFVAGAANTSYTVTYTPTGGTPTTVAPAPGTSPFTIGGLTANTTYTISVTANCGATPATAVTTTVRTLPPAAPYATVPYRMDFESTWLDVAATRDAPGVNWRNNTATGDESWRREDDAASASWTNPTLGTYTPTSSPLNGATGTHSARLHSAQSAMFGASALTLAVNLSQVGVKTLTFDYRNTNGLDSLGVYLSNDGGATRTLIGKGNNDATWVTKTFPLNSTSATALIIFEGYFALPNTSDIAIDNVNVSIVTATRATLAGSEVSVYPNPAHQAFTVAIPAVSGVRTAKLALVNSLGQTVRTQIVNLSAGTTQTQVEAAGLAAGLYTVRVQAGAETANVRLTVQ